MIGRAPVYVDSESGLNKNQMLKINSIIKSQLNQFYEKSIERESDASVKPLGTAFPSNVSVTSNNVFRNKFFMKGSLQIRKDTSHYVISYYDNNTHKIASLSSYGYFDTSMSVPLSFYGSITFDDEAIYLDLNTVPNYDVLDFQIEGSIKEE